MSERMRRVGLGWCDAFPPLIYCILRLCRVDRPLVGGHICACQSGYLLCHVCCTRRSLGQGHGKKDANKGLPCKIFRRVCAPLRI